VSDEWLIDGYNLLHSLKVGAEKEFLSSRSAFLERLASFASSTGSHVLVVLDGKAQDAELESYRTQFFQVIFSQDVSADCCIEKYLYEKRGQSSIMVVTKDRAISNMARGSGARVMANEQFIRLLQSIVKETKNILFEREVDSRKFHRPFEDKLKDFK